MNTKQVIVMRKDLKVRKGKYIAQGAHVAMMFLADLWRTGKPATEAEKDWLYGRFTKICVTVDSLEQLDAIAAKGREAGLKVYECIDAGLTEFKGEPTKTCIAIGPDEAEKIDAITGHLPLF